MLYCLRLYNFTLHFIYKEHIMELSFKDTSIDKAMCLILSAPELGQRRTADYKQPSLSLNHEPEFRADNCVSVTTTNLNLPNLITLSYLEF